MIFSKYYNVHVEIKHRYEEAALMKKKLLAVILVGIMAISLAACGSSGSQTTTNTDTAAKSEAAAVTEAPAAAGYTGDKYVYDGDNSSIKTEDIPEGYELIPYDKFEEVFNNNFGVGDGYFSTSTTYAEIAEAFGGEGIRMDGMVYEGYAYYVWLSDKDYAGGKVSLLVTFKNNNGNLTYYAYTGNGISK